MGKKSPQAPAAPDPVATAAAQTQQNKDTAYWNAVLNNVNQITPYGTLTYKQTGGGQQYDQAAYDKALAAYNAGGVGTQKKISSVLYSGKQLRGYRLDDGTIVDDTTNRFNVGDAYSIGGSRGAAPKLEDYKLEETPPEFTSTVALSPEQQALYNSQVQQQQQLMDLGGRQISRIQESANAPFSFAGVGNEVRAEDVLQAQRSAEEALMSRMNPQFARDEEALRTRLINQGIAQGSEAYNREMEQFGQAKNDARTQAILNAQRFGGTAQEQALQRRNQAIQEYTTQRNAPLNEYIGFTSGTQVQNPQFQSTGYQGAAPVDYAGLVNNKYAADMNAYNAKVASRNANMGALGSLAGTALSAGMGGGLFGFGGGSALPWQAAGNRISPILGGGFYG